MQLKKQLKPEWFTPPAAAADESRFAVLIRPMDSLQRLDVGNHIEVRANKTMVLSADGVELAWRYGVADWRGVTDDEGREVKYSAGLLGGLDRDVLRDVAWEVVFRSELSEDQKKTS